MIEKVARENCFEFNVLIFFILTIFKSFLLILMYIPLLSHSRTKLDWIIFFQEKSKFLAKITWIQDFSKNFLCHLFTYHILVIKSRNLISTNLLEI